MQKPSYIERFKIDYVFIGQITKTLNHHRCGLQIYPGPSNEWKTATYDLEARTLGDPSLPDEIYYPGRYQKMIRDEGGRGDAETPFQIYEDIAAFR